MRAGELVRRVRREGWTVEPTRGGHLRLRHPCGGLVHAASTPSDRRAVANTLAECRRELRRRKGGRAHGC